MPVSVGKPQRMPSVLTATETNDFPKGWTFPTGFGGAAAPSARIWSFCWPDASSKIVTDSEQPTASQRPFASMAVAPTRMSLSRGNGVLEGTSFTAQILGTSAGGILYALLKGDLIVGRLVLGQEWKIGAMLFVLAVIGTGSALLMRPIPAAAPNLKLSFRWWPPLRENLSILWKSKPLLLSVTGIAFCVFMTLFLRQTLFYQAELTKRSEVA